MSITFRIIKKMGKKNMAKEKRQKQAEPLNKERQKHNKEKQDKLMGRLLPTLANSATNELALLVTLST